MFIFLPALKSTGEAFVKARDCQSMDSLKLSVRVPRIKKYLSIGWINCSLNKLWHHTWDCHNLVFSPVFSSFFSFSTLHYSKHKYECVGIFSGCTKDKSLCAVGSDETITIPHKSKKKKKNLQIKLNNNFIYLEDCRNAFFYKN